MSTCMYSEIQTTWDYGQLTLQRGSPGLRWMGCAYQRGLDGMGMTRTQDTTRAASFTHSCYLRVMI